MSNKHTPSPWYVSNNVRHGVEYYNIGYTSQFRDCCVVDAVAPVTLITTDGNKPNIEGAANARLIAAAPEMLEVLLEAVDMLPNASHEHINQWLDAARAVIRKATEITP